MPSSSRTSSSKTWSRNGPEVLAHNSSSSTTSGSYKVPKQPTKAYKPARKEDHSTTRSIKTSTNRSVIQDSHRSESSRTSRRCRGSSRPKSSSRSSKGSSRRSHTPSHSESSSHSPPSPAPIPVFVPYTCTIRTHHFFNEVRERFTKPSTILSHPILKLLQQAHGGLPKKDEAPEIDNRLAYQKVIDLEMDNIQGMTFQRFFEPVKTTSQPKDDFAKKKEVTQISQESANQLFSDAIKTVTVAAEPTKKTTVDYSKYKIVKRVKASGSK